MVEDDHGMCKMYGPEQAVDAIKWLMANAHHEWSGAVPPVGEKAMFFIDRRDWLRYELQERE